MALNRRHVLYDVWVSEAELDLLNWVDPWPEILGQAAEISGAIVVNQIFHQFEPHGMTGILLLAESHISVHTWPEEKFAAIDIFSCGIMDIDVAISHLQQCLKPVNEKFMWISRGEDAP